MLPHAVAAPDYEEDEALPDNFARPEEADTGLLPISLTWLLARSKKRSEEEEQVLIMGNTIHGRRFDRIYQVDISPDNFAGEPYKDEQGQLRLSKDQKSQGVAWGRPAQIFGLYPVVIKEISHVGITQQHGPCTFVSSLAVCAAWERRFGRTLISRNIFPQRNGVPVLSPSGKYLVKMYLNGSVRKITIDDYLPVMQESPSTLLCSFSSAGDELWVSLFEKAYIKLHAGYDFPGSTSSVDLHALCGWIPETLHLDRSSANPVDPAEAWDRLQKGHSKGTALFTIGTRPLSDEASMYSPPHMTHMYDTHVSSSSYDTHRNATAVRRGGGPHGAGKPACVRGSGCR